MNTNKYIIQQLDYLTEDLIKHDGISLAEIVNALEQYTELLIEVNYGV